MMVPQHEGVRQKGGRFRYERNRVTADVPIALQGSRPLLALSRNFDLHCICPLWGAKQTWPFARIRFRGRYWG